MRTKLPLIVLVLIPWVNMSDAKADDDYQVPRTEWGLPDLQGVWNFNSSTPMQRPERFGTQEFLTPEEVKQIGYGRRSGGMHWMLWRLNW